MEKLFKNTFAVLFLLVLTSFTIPATVYICLSPGAESIYQGLNPEASSGQHEMKVVSKDAMEVKD